MLIIKATAGRFRFFVIGNGQRLEKHNSTGMLLPQWILIFRGGAAPTYPFNVEISATNFVQGTYSATVSCPVSCVSGGGTTYTTTINV